MSLWENRDGQLLLHQHPGQLRAWDSPRRFVAVLAGTQSGKTSWLPWWLYREIRQCGAGDYLAVTASYDLFKLKFLPALRETFEHVMRWGRYWSGDRIIELADPVTGKFLAKRADDPMWARIILRSAESGGGLESTTAKAAVADEAGQDSFTIETWEALLRRLAFHRGRCCLGTTLYNLGWLKQRIYDPWQAGDPTIEVVQFDSTENPAFPPEEAARARRDLPAWKYLMFYRGRYSRPAGLIYGSFKDFIADDHGQPGHLCPRFPIPARWPRYLGLDFGGVNTVGLFYASQPGTPRLYCYREYHAGSRTAKEHVAELRKGEPMNLVCVGGSPSEDQWRREFRLAGLAVKEPDVGAVEIGIDRVYGAHARDEIIVFDDLAGYRDQKTRYSRKLDAAGEPTAEIKDKAAYHFLDAERYIVGWLNRGVRVQADSAQSSSVRTW